MPRLNQKRKELEIKIVYYGAGLSGKTTNVQCINGSVEPGSRSELVSLATQQDRTLYFDYLAIDAGQVNGYNIRVSLFTVPGQHPYNRTRKEVLKEVDGIVFVADSSEAKWASNIDSFNNLLDNLKSLNIDAEKLPLVIQYNKRDLSDAMPVEKMENDLNRAGKVPSFECIALQGKGVMGTLKKIVQLVIATLHAGLAS